MQSSAKADREVTTHKRNEGFETLGSIEGVVLEQERRCELAKDRAGPREG
jgi:hypothetical protein